MATPRVIPKYRPAPHARLPPARLPLFRSVVAHPPPPFVAGEAVGVGSGNKSAAATLKPRTGPQQIIFSTSPRPLIPLTMSPTNHRLWNPPAADAKGSRVVERDESGRLARFANRFARERTESAEGEGEDGVGSAQAQGERQFAPEADLSFLEGETLQSPGTALGKRDIVGSPKSAKKGKK